MKNKNNQKLIFKIISVFAAVILWLMITYTEDSLIDVGVNSIDIQYKGEKTLLSRGFMITNKGDVPKASVKIRGRRGDLIAVMDSVRASVDLSTIESAGTYDLTPSFDIPSSAVYVSKRNTLSVPITVSKIVEKTVDVVLVQENAEKNKTYVVEGNPSVEQISVRGEINDLAMIGRAAIYIDVASLTDAGTVKLNPVYETSDGEKITLKNEILTDSSSIEVKYDVYEKKTVDVVVNLPHDLSEKNTVKLIGQEFKKIDIGVVEEKGNDVTSIMVDFKGIGEFVEGTGQYVLNLRVPDGVYIPEDKRQIEVELEVLPKTQAE